MTYLSDCLFFEFMISDRLGMLDIWQDRWHQHIIRYWRCLDIHLYLRSPPTCEIFCQSKYRGRLSKYILGDIVGGSSHSEDEWIVSLIIRHIVAHQRIHIFSIHISWSHRDDICFIDDDDIGMSDSLMCLRRLSCL